MESATTNPSTNIGGRGGGANSQHGYGTESCGQFQMPLHYPRYTQSDYETMPEWRLDCLLREYGLPIVGDLQHKRNFAMGAFLWHR